MNIAGQLGFESYGKNVMKKTGLHENLQDSLICMVTLCGFMLEPPLITDENTTP